MTASLTQAWQAALDLWRVRLADPVPDRAETLGSFAAYSMPPRVHIDLDDIERRGIAAHLVSILAHEVGHHVLAPATRIDSLKITHQMGRALDASATSGSLDVARAARFLGNLWCDMAINARVARMQAAASRGEPDMVTLWRTLGPAMAQTRLGWVVMRAYEQLWSVPAGNLCPPRPPDHTRGQQDEPGRRPSDAIADELRILAGTDPEGDALMLADTVRTFAADPVSGALTAGLLLAPYLVEQTEAQTGCGGALGLAPPSSSELQDVLRDPRLQAWPDEDTLGAEPADGADSAGQDYGLAATLALYADVPEQVVLSAWYLTQARAWVTPLHEAADAVDGEPIPGPRTTWEIGEDMEEIDWPASLELGPVMIPGVTTRRRETVPDEPQQASVPVQLDLYIDSSGSMRHPRNGSPAVLAATILVESVLRGGGRVRATSFSGPGDVSGSRRYTRDRTELMSHVLTYFAMGTTFPLDLLAARYLEDATATPRRKHLVVLSDDGLDSFFGRGQDGLMYVAPAVGRELDTGTLVLVVRTVGEHTRQQAEAAGYDVVVVPTVDDAPRVCAALAERLRGVPA